MSDWTTQDISGALAGDASALGRVVDHLMPVVHARVTRVLYRYAGSARGRDIRQEADDMVQEVFLALFDKDGKTLLDTIKFGPQLSDVSTGRLFDGKTTVGWVTFPVPTANAPNAPCVAVWLSPHTITFPGWV